ncbi:TVP38/TMEM64 family protein [Nostoc sp. NZL]|uniref:TVP38/TMEM64 family protein n=1 Tax=Nostoc sp. NZL TaxID=2650612 RepID=UPI001E363E61|nr:TVP38/TMEM64 family protein [Nostoc sp. NZL]
MTKLTIIQIFKNIGVLVYVRYTRRGTAVPCPYTWRYNFVPHLSGNRYIDARNLQRFFSLSGLILLLLAIAFALNTDPALAQESANPNSFNPQAILRDSLQWIDSLGALGAIAFIALYIIATVAFFPGSILTLGAGVIFGAVWGSLYVFIGATLGATAAFLVGRYLARGWIARKIADNKKFAAIDQAVGREGLKIVLLTRLSPIFPFNLLNYAFGITGVSLKDYFIGSVGMVPGTIMYVYIGSLAGNLAMIGTEAQPTNPTLQWAIRILGLIATVAVTVYVTRIARKALENEL